MADPEKRIRIIDETLREGMQFHGVVFTLEQRIRILEFQEKLGVDISQIGYPPALQKEADIVRKTAEYARNQNFAIRTAALGRALKQDADRLIQTGVDDPHFHFHIKTGLSNKDIQTNLNYLAALFNQVKTERPDAQISLAILEIGLSPLDLFKLCIDFFEGQPGLSILSLPDTSGIMSPAEVADRMKVAAAKTSRLTLATHCHNDLGMASANGFTGVMSGARILEATALGIGERNGISDLYTTARMLKRQGWDIKLDTDNEDGFKEYYSYVNSIVKTQTGLDLMGYTCPAFGEAVKTHVAGTHAQEGFGSSDEERFFLNPLCGKLLVKKYLEQENLSFDTGRLGDITKQVKSKSMELGRRLTRNEVASLLSDLDT